MKHIMKTIIIIYAVSWVLLLIALCVRFIIDRYGKSEEKFHPTTSDTILMFALAPIVIIITPFVLLPDWITKIKSKKRIATEKEERKKREDAYVAYLAMKLSVKPSKDPSYSRVASELFQIADKEKYDHLLSVLDKLTLPNGYRLEIKKPEEVGIGDESKLFVQCPDGEKEFDIFKYLRVEQSSMGVWQAHLLYTLWNTLPMFWHALYNERIYINGKEDLPLIHKYSRKHVNVQPIISGMSVNPEVVGIDGTYYVTYSYWSDFEGLIRVTDRIEIADNIIKGRYNVTQEVLYRYDCGIRY